jgi:L-ascorbate metabolism protein UlaG (beta-lactamase superfamily)
MPTVSTCPPHRGKLGVTFFGVASLLLDDGDAAVLTDGFFSRPSLLDVGLRRIAPDPARVDAVLARAGIRRLDVVAPVHTHFDHAPDAPLVAERTGAVAGGESTANVARGHGLCDERIRLVTPGESATLGSFR